MTISSDDLAVQDNRVFDPDTGSHSTTGQKHAVPYLGAIAYLNTGIEHGTLYLAAVDEIGCHERVVDTRGEPSGASPQPDESMRSPAAGR